MPSCPGCDKYCSDQWLLEEHMKTCQMLPAYKREPMSPEPQPIIEDTTEYWKERWRVAVQQRDNCYLQRNENVTKLLLVRDELIELTRQIKTERLLAAGWGRAARRYKEEARVYRELGREDTARFHQELQDARREQRMAVEREQFWIARYDNLKALVDRIRNWVLAMDGPQAAYWSSAIQHFRSGG